MTKLIDLVVPEVLVEAVEATFAGGLNALWGTGAVAVNNTFPGGINEVGTEVTVPYFGSIGEWETISDGAAFTPQKITQEDEKGPVVKIGKAFSSTDWARFAGAGDPYVEAAKQLLGGFGAAVDRLAITGGVASLPAMLTDIYSATTPRTLDYDAVVDARAKWGDESDDIALMVSHSKVESDVLKLKDATGRPLVTDAANGGLSKFAGIPWGKSDRVSASSATPPKYTTIIAKKNAIALWYNGKPVVEVGRDILGTSDIVVVSTYAVVHRYKRMPGKTKPGIALLTHN